jgi:hypothetical protein
MPGLQGTDLTISFQIGHMMLIHLAESQGSKIVIPPKSTRINQREYDRHIYKERHLVECFLGTSVAQAPFGSLKVLKEEVVAEKFSKEIFKDFCSSLANRDF